MHYTEIMPKFTVDGSVINICQRVVKIKIFYFFSPSQVHGPFAVSRSYKQVKVKLSLCGDWDEGRAEPEMLRGQVCPRARALDTDAVWMPVGWSARVSRTKGRGCCAPRHPRACRRGPAHGAPCCPPLWGIFFPLESLENQYLEQHTTLLLYIWQEPEIPCISSTETHREKECFAD